MRASGRGRTGKTPRKTGSRDSGSNRPSDIDWSDPAATGRAIQKAWDEPQRAVEPGRLDDGHGVTERRGSLRRTLRNAYLAVTAALVVFLIVYVLLQPSDPDPVAFETTIDVTSDDKATRVSFTPLRMKDPMESDEFDIRRVVGVEFELRNEGDAPVEVNLSEMAIAIDNADDPIFPEEASGQSTLMKPGDVTKQTVRFSVLFNSTLEYLRVTMEDGNVAVWTLPPKPTSVDMGAADPPTEVESGEVESLMVRGQTISVGLAAVEVYEVLSSDDQREPPTVEHVSTELRVTHYYIVDGERFDITYGRRGAGPNVVLSIRVL